MFSSLQMIFERLLADVDTRYQRYLFHEFTLSNRLTGLVGPRGVGKTTLLLQVIKTQFATTESVFYFSADHIYFKSATLYEFVEGLYLNNGITTVFIDEIHKYSNWSQELKNLYDGFPQLTIIFSGSSSLDLVKGAYDLSRRAKMYHLPGLSFREYLQFFHDIELPQLAFPDLLANAVSLNQAMVAIPGILGHYHHYLQYGFYPFVKDDPLSYYEKILLTIEKTIYEDIANFYNLKTANLVHLSKILNFISTIPPGNINIHNLAKNLNINDKTAASYLTMLNETGLITLIYAAEGGNQGLRKPQKIFFDNTNLHYAISEHSPQATDIGSIRELAFLQATTNAQLTVNYSQQGDFQINEAIFEIGGKNKTRQQVKGLGNAFIIKDDIIAASHGVIPLLFFGLLY
ncbi:MAG: ATPase [Legionellales bacterium]|nr:ATPase [Legionellales bacterium]